MPFSARCRRQRINLLDFDLEVVAKRQSCQFQERSAHLIRQGTSNSQFRPCWAGLNQDPAVMADDFSDFDAIDRRKVPGSIGKMKHMFVAPKDPRDGWQASSATTLWSLFDIIARAITQQRSGIAIERSHDKFADFSDFTNRAVLSDIFGQHLFALNMKKPAFRTFNSDHTAL